MKKKEPKISAIMSIYNEPLDYVKRSVESILNQTIRNIEFIVIIDNPQRSELIELMRNFNKKDKRIRLVINEKNLGLTASLNKAISIANGKYIARMDADDISMEDRLELQLKHMNKYDLDIVGCNITNIDEDDKILSCSKYPVSDSGIKKYLRIDSAIPHPTWFIKKEVFDSYRYIDFLFCEDYGFLVNSSLRKYKMGNVKDCKLMYRNNSNGISSTKKIQQKTGMFYLRKNYRCGKMSDYDGYLKFINSKAAENKARVLEKYYNKKKIIKDGIRQKRYIKTFFNIIILLCSVEARRNIMNRFKKKYIMMKESK